MKTKFGKVFRFQSELVKNNDPKPKYHVVISIDELTFLFINSRPFEDSFRIVRDDWPAMPKLESYISCNSVQRYTPEMLQELELKPEHCGELSKDCLKRLRDHLPECDSLSTADLTYLQKIFKDELGK